MRWERLFDDLEAQLELEHLRELDGEVADRIRRERAQIQLQARLLGTVGAGPVSVRLPGGTETGAVIDVGPDWVLLDRPPDRVVLVPTAAVRSFTGLAPRALEPSLVARRFTLRLVLSALSRDRAVVEVVDIDGGRTVGTIDVVGADHLDLAEHAADEPRRSRNVVRRLVLPFWSVAAVRRL